jgi:hypothetical protein
MSTQLTVPISAGSPYMPVATYTIAWPIVMMSVRTFSNTLLHSQPGPGTSECMSFLVRRVQGLGAKKRVGIGKFGSGKT